MKSLVSTIEINELCEALILDYIKSSNCCCIDIEGFITEYLKLNIVYVSFAEEDTSKFGYLSDGKQGIWIYKNKKKTFEVFPKFTIVIDQFLLRAEESGKRRFTLAHEAGHFLMSKHNPIQTIPSYRRDFDVERQYSKNELAEMFSLGEFLADKTAACLLMPKFILDRVVGKYYQKKKIVVYGNNIFSSEDKINLKKISDDIGVSYSALIIRLKNLNYLEYRSANEYIDTFLQVGEYC